MINILTPELVLLAYRHGYFPMADEETGEIYWHSPDPRAIIPLDRVQVSRSLRQTIRKNIYEIRINTACEDVIALCANREETWISDDILAVYSHLHDLGYVHSVEAWQDGELVGGLYGMAIGGAFFGESMFSLRTDASKVAFIALVEHLRTRNYTLLDSQYINPHMRRLGAVEVPRNVYMSQLAQALLFNKKFDG